MLTGIVHACIKLTELKIFSLNVLCRRLSTRPTAQELRERNILKCKYMYLRGVNTQKLCQNDRNVNLL